jgi:hypothetical protein
MDHRTDRREQFLNEMDTHGISRTLFTRVAGVPHKLATLGASIAWLSALNICARRENGICCFFDDDFMYVSPFRNDSTATRTFFWELLYSFPFIFDGVFLSGAFKHPLQSHTHSETDHALIFRAKAIFGASGMCITKQYISDVLSFNVEEGIRLQKAHFNSTGIANPEFTFDFYMRKLQTVDNWFAVKVGTQRPTFSDIEKKMVSYEW